jgi:hypothetical protein
MATPTNLPASFVTGAVLTAAQQNDLRGAFRVLQVVSATNSTLVSNSTNVFADTGLTANITCQSTTSKVLVIVSQSFGKATGNANNAVQSRIMRGATNIIQFQVAACFNGSDSNFVGPSSSCVFLDSPASIAAQTYKTQFCNFTNAASVSANTNSATATITLFEISA